jgi:hypothetical protein
MSGNLLIAPVSGFICAQKVFGQQNLIGWMGGGRGLGNAPGIRRRRDARQTVPFPETRPMPLKRKLSVLVPQRLRKMPPSFAWIDHQLRAQGWLQRFEPADYALYLFLVLAADRDGLSCWRLDRIERAVPCFDRQALWQARERMMENELIAFRPWRPGGIDGSYQVLSIRPPQPNLPSELRETFNNVFRRVDP